MSHHADGAYDVYSETPYRARKAHVCSACERDILPGQRYVKVFWRFDGGAESIKRCGACQATHKHLRELGAYHDMWPSETLDCGLDYREEWEEEPPPEVAALAFASGEEASALLGAGCQMLRWASAGQQKRRGTRFDSVRYAPVHGVWPSLTTAWDWQLAAARREAQRNE